MSLLHRLNTDSPVNSIYGGGGGRCFLNSMFLFPVIHIELMINDLNDNSEV